MTARALVLAAGHSARMGHPKALTRVGGEPALARIVRTCAAAGLARPVVVLGAHHDIVRAALPTLDVAWTRNPEPDAGRTGSLQVALRAAGALDAALVWPVDHPLVDAETVRALVATDGAWVVPSWQARHGHPIVLRSAALDAVRAAAPDAPLRDVLAGAGVAPTRVPVADAGVRANLDRPEDVPPHA